MDFRVLGPLEASAGDGPLPLGGERQRAVLAVLLLSANRVVGRERLIHDLWGDEPPETAVATLQAYVSRLRKLLPDGVLVTRPPGYLVVAEPDELDLLRFESLVAEARKADGGAEPRSCCARRSGCGAGRRWPSSPPSRSRGSKQPASTTCVSRRSRSGSRRISRSGARRR